MFTLAKTQQGSALVRPVIGIGQTGVAWALRMNSTRGSTPPNPTPDLPNHSTDLRKTLGIVGTPHGKSIAKILSTKTCQIKRNRRNPAKNSSNPRTPKPPKSSPFAHGFGRESKGKEPRRVHAYISPKITKKNEWEQHIQALRNHADSSIHHKEVHTRSS
jgi:hypothetical protein